ncbi:MAG: CDP-diacylglycerol--glycerol-3-phosphate 3-phosphatidyltransferase [Holosporaceae bacterium]|nr:CDP-diacylglycerol--glycerol-3-phosphate 3-phosphatidyltransferase [Holosporaceae bacterium]
MLPNLLTLSRIFSIPFIVACFYVGGFWAHLTATILFVVACITDFFDGYFAREWKQISAFGRFLDPVADKVLVSTILLMLSGTGVIHGAHLVGAAIILAREIIVSGLRQFMSELQMRVPVTRYAKWKTAMQMVSISCLLCSAMFPDIVLLEQAGLALLWMAVAMTVFTGVRYLKFEIVRMAGSAS